MNNVGPRTEKIISNDIHPKVLNYESFSWLFRIFVYLRS